MSPDPGHRTPAQSADLLTTAEMAEALAPSSSASQAYEIARTSEIIERAYMATFSTGLVSSLACTTTPR
jgi:hypothetical protein